MAKLSTTHIKHMISIGQAAEVTSLSTRTIRRMIARGEIPAVRLGKRTIRVAEEDLLRALRPIPTTGGDAA